MQSARYIDLKRFAVHDGPGIRTTLFLKGCPLRCLWCHNPESRFPQPELAIHFPKCRFCGSCEHLCPCHHIHDGQHDFNRASCRACGKCVEACPAEALELFGKSISVEEAAAKLLEDKIFYADGGGITLSGGEPLLQSAFCADLLSRMKKEGLHTAVDTCGHVPWNAFEEVLPFTDLFLYDFKCADSEKHRQFTGQGNERILENLRRLDTTGKPIEIRIPLVPQHNFSQEDLQATGAILKPLKHITAVRLLAYHSLARSKFLAVGHPDTMPNVPSPTCEDLEDAATLLRAFGLPVINSLK